MNLCGCERYVSYIIIHCSAAFDCILTAGCRARTVGSPVTKAEAELTSQCAKTAWGQLRRVKGTFEPVPACPYRPQSAAMARAAASAERRRTGTNGAMAPGSKSDALSLKNLRQRAINERLVCA